MDRQIEANLNSQLQQLAAQGIDPRSLKLDWEKIRESQKERAERDVRASLILDKISDREAIAATQEDVDREVQRYARQQREAVAVVRAKLQKDGTLNRIVGQIRTEKTLELPVRQGSQGSAEAGRSAAGCRRGGRGGSERRESERAEFLADAAHVLGAVFQIHRF